MSHDINDARLGPLLREWKVDAALPLRFDEQVWRRIERAEAPRAFTPWDVFRSWMEAALSRPAFATAYVAVLLVTGLLAGNWQAQRANEYGQSRARAHYVQSVDPYQMDRR